MEVAGLLSASATSQTARTSSLKPAASPYHVCTSARTRPLHYYSPQNILILFHCTMLGMRIAVAVALAASAAGAGANLAGLLSAGQFYHEGTSYKTDRWVVGGAKGARVLSFSVLPSFPLSAKDDLWHQSRNARAFRHDCTPGLLCRHIPSFCVQTMIIPSTLRLMTPHRLFVMLLLVLLVLLVRAVLLHAGTCTGSRWCRTTRWTT